MVLAPEERCEAVLNVIRGARRRIILSLFRCDDFRVLDGLAEALHRDVAVEVLISRRSKGWRKRLKQLKKFIGSMGAKVYRYADPVVKYHAKYIVADDGPALVASLNFTRKCFTDTCDFLHLSWDREVVEGLQQLFEADCRAPESETPDGLSDRLIIGPEHARRQLTALLENARRSIHIIDHKVTDPTIRALLLAKQAAGVEVQVLKRKQMGKLVSHGKMILVDEEAAVIGSIALSALAMDFRREVALLIRDRDSVGRLSAFFQELAAAPAALPKRKAPKKKGKRS